MSEKPSSETKVNESTIIETTPTPNIETSSMQVKRSEHKKEKSKPAKSKVRKRNILPTDIATYNKSDALKLEFAKDSLATIIIEKLRAIDSLPEDKQKEARSKLRESLKTRKFDGESYSEATISTQVNRGMVYLKIISR